MEDLKIIFYIVVAIGWVIYNNYKKITKEAEGRNPQKPFNQSPHENWPPFPVDETKTQTPTPIPVPASPVKKQFTHKLAKTKKADSVFLSTPIQTNEGGTALPSSSAVFSKVPEHEYDTEHPWLAEFRSGTDWRKVVIGSEILQRPYN